MRYRMELTNMKNPFHCGRCMWNKRTNPPWRKCECENSGQNGGNWNFRNRTTQLRQFDDRHVYDKKCGWSENKQFPQSAREKATKGHRQHSAGMISILWKIFAISQEAVEKVAFTIRFANCNLSCIAWLFFSLYFTTKKPYNYSVSTLIPMQPPSKHQAKQEACNGVTTQVVQMCWDLCPIASCSHFSNNLPPQWNPTFIIFCMKPLFAIPPPVSHRVIKSNMGCPLHPQIYLVIAADKEESRGKLVALLLSPLTPPFSAASWFAGFVQCNRVERKTRKKI